MSGMLNRRTLAVAAVLVSWQAEPAIAPEAHALQTNAVALVKLYYAAQAFASALGHGEIPVPQAWIDALSQRLHGPKVDD
jgi:hypothetical protein